MKEKPKIIDCFCVWYDLLGFGAPFKKAKWNLHNEECFRNYDRMKKLEGKIHIPFANEKTLLINDGVIKTFDVERLDYDNDMKKIINFLIVFIDGFFEINRIDKIGDLYGARGVFTYGQRFEHINANFSYMPHNGEVITYFPKEFQMNTAFSKANIIEESGSAYGVHGSNLFFDGEALEEIRIIASKTKSYTIKEDQDENRREFDILICGQSIIKLIFQKKLIKYNHQNIETDLWCLIDMELRKS